MCCARAGLFEKMKAWRLLIESSFTRMMGDMLRRRRNASSVSAEQVSANESTSETSSSELQTRRRVS